MRLTIIAFGSRGDLHPYLALGKGLAARHHEVTIATYERFEPEVISNGLRFAAVAEGSLSRGPSTAEGYRWHHRRSHILPDWAGVLEDARSVAERRLADCWAATSNADGIVVSLLATILGLQLSTIFDIPLVRAYYAPLGWHESAVGRRAIWLSARPHVNSARRSKGLPPLPLSDPFEALDRAQVPILYGFSPSVVALDDEDRDWVHVTGYWMLDQANEWAPSTELIEFLDDGPPPVLVSFGSMLDRDPEATDQLFINALRHAGQRGILTREHQTNAEVATPSFIHRGGFIPYDWLFPRLGAIAHHGGAGTTALGLRAGLPSVLIPSFADQAFWARQVERLRVGPPPIPRRRLTDEKLGDAIHLAVHDPLFRSRAKRLAQAIRSEDGIGRAVEIIESHIGGRPGHGAPTHPSVEVGSPTKNGFRAQPRCPLCGSEGELLYEDVRDRLYDNRGSWSHRSCLQDDCDALWIDPVATEDHVGDLYKTYYTHESTTPPRLRRIENFLAELRRAYVGERFGYDTDGRWRTAALGRTTRFAARLFPGGRMALDDGACHLEHPRPGARLLEIGSGGGGQLERMKELGWNVVGVDTDPVAAEAALRRGVDTRVGELTDHRFPDDSFDAIYLSHLIEHVHAPVALLAECHRILKPGGQLVAITPNIESRGHQKYRAAWFGLDPPRHLVVFGPRSLETTAARAGFTTASVTTSARIAFICSIASCDIRDRGTVDSFDDAVPLGRLARGVFAQIVEAAMLARQPMLGEELILQATKTATPYRPSTDHALHRRQPARSRAGP